MSRLAKLMWTQGNVRLLAALFLLSVIPGPGLVRAQIIDLNHNGMSDVWEWVYNAYGISPGIDTDGDGDLNWQEAIAGTNPFDSNSYPHIASFAYVAPHFSVTVPGTPGKLYQLESILTTGPGTTNWVTETNLVNRAGTNVTLTVPLTATAKMYRVAISDVDSDGSGLMNDWEKYQLGLDPSNAWSNGQEDGNGNALRACLKNDFSGWTAFVHGRLARWPDAKLFVSE